MKTSSQLFSISIISIFLLLSGCFGTTTHIYLVRHAEKDTINPNDSNPNLMQPEGVTRASELARVLGQTGIDAVYSTNFNRTRQTAQPTATLIGQGDPMIYDHNALEALVDTVMKRHRGGEVLIVGHSNTTPDLINAFGGTAPVNEIPETQYDNLYLLIVQRQTKNGSYEYRTKTLPMKYGSTSP